MPQQNPVTEAQTLRDARLVHDAYQMACVDLNNRLAINPYLSAMLREAIQNAIRQTAEAETAEFETIEQSRYFKRA